MTLFDELVQKLKSGIHDEENAELKNQVQQILDRVSRALDKTPLTREHKEQVFAIVNQAFSEGNLPLLIKINMEPGIEQSADLLGFCVVGDYPKAAYNLSIHKQERGLTLYLWEVPQNGNLRS